MKAFWLTAAVLGGLALPAASRAAVSEAAFQLQRTSDLVEVCGADRSDPRYVAAIHLCQGFMAGTYRTAVEYESARRAAHLFCPPASGPMPTRDEAASAFVQWANAHPDAMDLPAADGLIRFIADRFPCATQARRGGRS